MYSFYSRLSSLKAKVLIAVIAFCGFTVVKSQSAYVAGDFHQHSTFTDGSWNIHHVMKENNEFGLDWWANSEHGGSRNRDGRFSGIDLGTTLYYDQDESVVFLGDSVVSGGHRLMWRWQILRDFSYPEVLKARDSFPSKVILQSFEWNVPGHEHGSVGLIDNQFQSGSNCNPLAQFEYIFDAGDSDQTGGAAQGWTKSVKDGHEKTLEGIRWLQNNYPSTSYVVLAHPERKKKYTVADFRDMNNAGPDVCFGFESMSGHQKSSNRGGYSTSADGGGTFGGCGYYAARVGGLWDALLSEGRNFWLFASSDFHDIGGDFYPGEYQKTYTYVSDKSSPQAIVDGLRSGNSYVVCGDLIEDLDFKIKDASMGETLVADDDEVIITIKVYDPEGENNNTYSTYKKPVLHHIDLVKGAVSDKINPSSEKYAVDTVVTTSVVARFDAAGGISDANGITSIAWTDLGGGWKEMSISMPTNEGAYYRLRGTNMELNVENETDANGNPLSDFLSPLDGAEEAFADLWFYSNPIFVKKTVASSLNKSDLSLLKVYPNPVTNVLNIDSKSVISGVEVYSISGKLIKNKMTSEKRVDLEKIPAGIYVLKVKLENEVLITRFVKE